MTTRSRLPEQPPFNAAGVPPVAGSRSGLLCDDAPEHLDISWPFIHRQLTDEESPVAQAALRRSVALLTPKDTLDQPKELRQLTPPDRPLGWSREIGRAHV